MISAATAIVVREGLTFIAQSFKQLLEPHDESAGKGEVETVSEVGI